MLWASGALPIQSTSGDLVASKPIVRLLDRFGYYFPVAASDVKVMQSLGLNAHRIPSAMLPVLRSTVLKSVSVSLHSWPDVWARIMSNFMDALPTSVRTKTETDRQSKDPAEATTLLCMVGSSELSAEEHEEALDSFEERLAALKQYCGRYCTGLIVESKGKLDGKLFRIRFTTNKAINTAGFFSERPIVVTETVLNLSPNFRLVWSIETHNGRDLIRLRAEDVESNKWTAKLDRAFPVDAYKADELAALINFFSSSL